MHPNQIADLILSGSMLRQATLIALDSDGERGTGTLTLMRGSRELMTANLPRALADATAARLAMMAGIPLGRHGERLGRLRVRVGGEVADMIAAVRDTPFGLAAELRPLTYGGRPVVVAESHVLARCPACLAIYPARETTCICGVALTPMVEHADVGGTVGCYQLDSVAGSGGMGIVYFGTHALIGRKIALKVLHESFLGDDEMAGRFLIEARAASRLHHPGIVDISDYGLLADGRPYIVMERLDGEPLSERLKRERALEPRTAVLLMRQVAEALAHAHRHGVIHQDLKPANILMLDGSSDDAPLCKVIDFGAARAISGEPEGETMLDKKGQILGTPLYMAPEHCRGKRTDARSDVYSLGVVLYELVTGGPPFYAADPMEILRQHVYCPAPAPVGAVDDLPRSLVELLTRALQKSPDARQQSAGELADELAAVLS